jgi:hypothetical protein
MRTVTLEFLRHGPRHGHLLSPLARYMALCGSHEPADVSVPFDHSELLTRLRTLLYKDSQETRELQLADTARAMSKVLAAVPGLVADLADSCGAAEPGPIHLRIIFNANELALLPFELANAASAFPGAGQSLALQPQVPLCITREVRQAGWGAVEWPRAPRILFAASSAGGEIPVKQHLLVFRQALEPWMYHYEDDTERQKRLDEHLTFLPMASVEGLLEACGSGEYTHVHLLAHGVPMDRDDGRRYGLALHGTQDPNTMDVVDGTRLATLLRPNWKGKIQKLVRPAVVTLAACDAGNVGSVIGAGASIAHSLHEAGIPLVVASQFPLSFGGSVVMTQVLYEGLLSGTDPRLLLIDVRRQLKVRVRGTHDWASVVAYASLPADFDPQLARVRFDRASRSIEAALNYADRLTLATSDLLSSTPKGAKRRQTSMATTDSEKTLDTAKGKLRQAMDRMKAVRDSNLVDQSQIHGYLASAEKRKAEIFWRAPRDSSEYPYEPLAALEQSRVHYRKSFEADRSQSWALVQTMVLTVALEGASKLNPDEMTLARLLSVEDTNSDDKRRRAWAYGNLLELRLLSELYLSVQPAAAIPSGELPWEGNVDELVRAVGVDAAEVHSTRRQLQRWVEFFPSVRDQTAQRQKPPVKEQQWSNATTMAGNMFARMPEPPQFS